MQISTIYIEYYRPQFNREPCSHCDEQDVIQISVPHPQTGKTHEYTILNGGDVYTEDTFDFGSIISEIEKELNLSHLKQDIYPVFKENDPNLYLELRFDHNKLSTEEARKALQAYNASALDTAILLSESDKYATIHIAHDLAHTILEKAITSLLNHPQNLRLYNWISTVNRDLVDGVLLKMGASYITFEYNGYSGMSPFGNESYFESIGIPISFSSVMAEVCPISGELYILGYFNVDEDKLHPIGTNEDTTMSEAC